MHLMWKRVSRECYLVSQMHCGRFSYRPVSHLKQHHSVVQDNNTILTLWHVLDSLNMHLNCCNAEPQRPPALSLQQQQSCICAACKELNLALPSNSWNSSRWNSSQATLVYFIFMLCFVLLRSSSRQSACKRDDYHFFQQSTIGHLLDQLFARSLHLLIWSDDCRQRRGDSVFPAVQSADHWRLECSPLFRLIKALLPASVRVCACMCDPALRVNKHAWWMDGRRSEYCDWGLGIMKK